MAVRRKQRVVLRAKVKRERWNHFRQFALKKILLFIALAGCAFSVHYLLFVHDFFMIKSVQVPAHDEKIGPQIQQRMSRLKGRSIFRLRTATVERELRQSYPALSEVSVKRGFPDRLSVGYELRRPYARVRIAPSDDRPSFPSARPSSHVADESGAVFPPPKQSAAVGSMAEVVIPSTRSAASAIAFLKQWEKTQAKQDEAEVSKLRAEQVALDRWGEITLFVRPESQIAEVATATSATRIVWGEDRPEHFSEKFARLEDVWVDLKKRAIEPESINLREVPRKDNTPLDDRQIVGRVLVRPRVLIKAGQPAVHTIHLKDPDLQVHSISREVQ